MITRTPLASAAASAAFAARSVFGNGASVTSATASDSSRIEAMTAGSSNGLIGFTAPMNCAPSIVAVVSGRFGNSVATVSPGRTPAA